MQLLRCYAEDSTFFVACVEQVFGHLFGILFFYREDYKKHEEKTLDLLVSRRIHHVEPLRNVAEDGHS